MGPCMWSLLDHKPRIKSTKVGRYSSSKPNTRGNQRSTALAGAPGVGAVWALGWVVDMVRCDDRAVVATGETDPVVTSGLGPAIIPMAPAWGNSTTPPVVAAARRSHASFSTAPTTAAAPLSCKRPSSAALCGTELTFRRATISAAPARDVMISASEKCCAAGVSMMTRS